MFAIKAVRLFVCRLPITEVSPLRPFSGWDHGANRFFGRNKDPHPLSIFSPRGANFPSSYIPKEVICSGLNRFFSSRSTESMLEWAMSFENRRFEQHFVGPVAATPCFCVDHHVLVETPARGNVGKRRPPRVLCLAPPWGFFQRKRSPRGGKTPVASSPEVVVSNPFKTCSQPMQGHRL